MRFQVKYLDNKDVEHTTEVDVMRGEFVSVITRYQDNNCVKILSYKEVANAKGKANNKD